MINTPIFIISDEMLTNKRLKSSCSIQVLFANFILLYVGEAQGCYSCPLNTLFSPSLGTWSFEFKNKPRFFFIKEILSRLIKQSGL